MKFLLFILSLTFLTDPQGFELKYELSFHVNGSAFKVDMLGNIYVIENQILAKYSVTGEKIKEYSNKYLGSISYLDVSDPFRILLFYKDFNQVLFLDNYLAEIRSPVKLDDLKMDQADIVCSSSQGGFWVFNNQSGQLVYFDSNLKKQQESVSLNSINVALKKPVLLFEKSDFLYMYIPLIGILVFDKYGAYFKTLNLGEIPDFQVADGKVIYLQNNSVFKYDMKYLSTVQLTLPDSLMNVKAVNILKDKLFVLRDKLLTIYTVKEK